MAQADRGPDRSIAVPVSFNPANEALVARRDALVETTRTDPVARLASFLAYLAHANGRDNGTARIADDLHCGTVAEWLGMTVDDLQSHLVFLGCLGLIEPDASGALNIIDIDGLDRLVNGALQPAGAVK